MFNKTEMISDEIRKLTPVLGKDVAQRLSRVYLMGDETSRERIAELVDIVKASVMSDSDLNDSALMEPPEHCEGEISLGHVLYGRKRMTPLKIKKEQLLTHIGIFGSSGYGKTNLSMTLVKQISEDNVPVIIFDFSKRNYRDMGIESDVYTVGRDIAPFRFNPLNPPAGTSKSQWIKEFASIFDHAYWLLGGGQHVILKALNEVSMQKKNPRMRDLKENLEKSDSKTSREKNWGATAMRPLESLDLDGIREVFDCEIGTKPSDLLVPGKVTVLELDALSPNDRTFFIEIFLQWLRDHLLTSGEREQLKAVVLIEEAHHMLNREKLKKLGAETVMDTIFREIRELGVGIIYCDQHPSLVSYPALGNTSMQVYMNLGLDSKHASDIQDAANMLGIEDNDYLRRLPVGHGFVLIRNSSFPYTFLAEFDKMDIRKGYVSDEAIHEKMRSKTKYNNEDITTYDGDLDVNMEKLLRAIGAGKGVTTSQLYKSVRMSGSTFNHYLNKLEKSGLVGTKEVKNGKTHAKLCYLTKTGEKAVGPKIFSGAIEMNDMSNVFRDGGWTVTRKDDYLFLEKNNETVRVFILDRQDRAAIDSAVSGGSHYICGSNGIKNVLLQQAARKKEGMMIFVSTLDDFQRTGGFEAIRL